MKKSRKEEFQSILYLYGFGAIILLKRYARDIEAYEDLQIMKDLYATHGIPEDETIEDWICEFWKQGMSGETALSNLYSYFTESVNKLYRRQ